MSQKDQVIDAMKGNGGYATLHQLNQLVDVSDWKSRTPYASIRRIVQENKNIFFRIKPGLWALREYEKEVFEKLSMPSKRECGGNDIFSHSYYQGVLVELGNMHNFETYIPVQDKNRLFLEKPLSELATISSLPKFTYDNLLRSARTVDCIWFNERKMPFRFYEVEHSTDIRNSLDKFYELQDFRSDCYIVADKVRERQFQDIIGKSMYGPIRAHVKFFSYEHLIRQYERESEMIERL